MAANSTKDTEVENNQDILVWLPNNPIQEACFVNYVLFVANLLYLGVNGYVFSLAGPGTRSVRHRGPTPGWKTRNCGFS